MTTSVGAQGLGSDLRVLSWEGYQDGAFHTQFVEAHGASPSFAVMQDEADAFSKLRGGYLADIAQPCAYSIGAWVDAGVLRPIDTAWLQHWNDIWKPLRNLPRVLDNDLDWFVPLDWGPGGIIYRTDLLPDPDPSWWLLYDEDLKGRIAMQASSQAVVGAAALAVGVADPWSMSNGEQEVVQRLITKQADLVTGFWSDPRVAQDGLERGDLVASYGTNDLYARLLAADVPVGFLAPREGYLTWVCGLSLLAAGNEDESLAYDFIDAMLAPETGKAIISRLGYGHANHKSFDLVSEGLLDRLALTAPRQILEKSEFFDLSTAGAGPQYDALFLGGLEQS
ncbi:MAG: ABC transporter substrate-binding protein, partial [Alphaproteobacteria bacterium]